VRPGAEALTILEQARPEDCDETIRQLFAFERFLIEIGDTDRHTLVEASET
jgi:hypothetical protein